MATVRNFSAAGPCIEQGELIRETPSFYIFRDRFGDGERRLAKRLPGRYSGSHTEPCPSCRDHPQTQYPDGYMN